MEAFIRSYLAAGSAGAEPPNASTASLEVTVACEHGTASLSVSAEALSVELLARVAEEFGTAPDLVTLVCNNDVVDPATPVSDLPTLRLEAIVTGATRAPLEQRLPAHVETLLDSVRAGTHVGALDLRSASLRDRGATLLSVALRNNAHISSVFLAHNRIGDEGARALAGALPESAVRVLNLDDNDIGDVGLVSLAEALRANTVLHSLSLASNCPTELGAAALRRALEVNRTLTYLFIDGGDGVRAAFGDLVDSTFAVTVNVRLREAFHDAIRKGDVQQVRYCLATGVDTGSLTHTHESVLHYAVHSASSADVLESLFQSNCFSQINQQDEHGRTPFHLACHLGNVAHISILLTAGADPTLKDAAGKWPHEMSTVAEPAVRNTLVAMARQRMLHGDVPALAVVLERLARLMPDALSELFGTYAATVAVSLSNHQPLHPTLATSLAAPERWSAVKRLEATIANTSLLPQDRGLAGVLEALILQELDEEDEARRLFGQHSRVCTGTAAHFLWQMRGYLPVARGSTTPDSWRCLCGAAVAYLAAADGNYPARWADEAKRILSQFAALVVDGTAVTTLERVHPGRPAPVTSLADRWQAILQQRPTSETAALAELMNLVGLHAVKDRMVSLFEELEVRRDQGRSAHSFNFHARFEGNPGTGKSTVVALYGKILCECGVFNAASAVIERTTGSKLIDLGSSKLKDLLDKLNPGILFVDEAYQLDPQANLTGRQVLNLLMDEMEERRGKLVVVIAGYAKQLEKLVEFNPGLPSRFPQRYVFVDYTDDELLALLLDLIRKEGFRADDERWCRIAIQRIGRVRGRDGFGNAREVRNFWEVTVQKRQAVRIVDERRAGAHPDIKLITRTDLLGPKATRESLLQRCAAYKELQQMHGLAEVKRYVDQIVNAAAQNAELEERGEPLVELNLNTVFLGNPGTGKTTVAKLFAAILRDLGLLSKGEVIYKTASDFNGTVVGEATKTTLAILEAARGSVLVIDEAYVLDPGSGFSGSGGDPYKTDVVNTIVDKVQGKPGDDIAVVLLGYRDEMEKMLRNANSGLSRRFNLENAVVFCDYDNDALGSILAAAARKAGFKVGVAATLAALDVLERQRALPNFGNAGAVTNLLSRATLAMQDRLLRQPAAAAVAFPHTKELLAEDFAQASDVRPPTDEELGASLARVRADVANRVQRARAAGRNVAGELEYGYLFVGPPGVGKTTAARLVGRMLRALDVVHEPTVIEKQPRDFLTGYAQQAGKQTEAIFKACLGKVLFIDEAYTLLNEDPSDQVLGAICGLMEAEYKGKLVVILAGYKPDIAALLARNSGLRSRFPAIVYFDAWDSRQACKVLRAYLSSRDMVLASDADTGLLTLMETLIEAPGWSSGRDVVTLGKALYGKVELGSMVTLAHVRAAVTDLIANKAAMETSPPSVQASAALILPKLATASQGPRTTATSVAQLPVHFDIASRAEITNEEEDPRNPSVLRSLMEQGLAENAARRLLDQWEAYTKELARLAEAERLRQEAEERRRREMEEAAKRAADEAERARLEEEAQRIRVEQARQQAIQEKLARYGKCQAGYNWVYVGNGWRCTAGGHYVSDAML